MVPDVPWRWDQENTHIPSPYRTHGFIGALRSVSRSWRGAREREGESMKTVRVRIAVAVNEQGKWNAFGYSSSSDENSKQLAFECLDGEGVESLYWIEADLPIPSPTIIEGTVTDQGK